MGYGDKIMATVHDRAAGDWYSLRWDTHRFYFNPAFKVRPGVLVIRSSLKRWAAAALQAAGVSSESVMIEPNIKGTVSGNNKDWGWHRWLELVARRDPAKPPLLQCDYGAPILPGAVPIKSPSFNHACALLAAVRGVVTTAGGLQHAAGALRKPAVVIFGGYDLPSILGYDFHTNLAVDCPECAGRRQSDPACAKAMAQITVDQVHTAMETTFPC